MKYIFIINGKPRSGKDTFVNILRDTSNYPVFEYSIVSRIKEIAPVFGWNGKKDFKGRKLLADLVDVADNYNDFCFNSVIEKEEVISQVKDIFIYCIHSRRPKDIKKFVQHYTKDNYKVITIFIQRDSISNKKESNTADSDVLDYTYDYYIENNDESNLWEQEFKYNIELFYKDVMNENILH